MSVSFGAPCWFFGWHFLGKNNITRHWASEPILCGWVQLCSCHLVSIRNWIRNLSWCCFDSLSLTRPGVMAYPLKTWFLRCLVAFSARSVMAYPWKCPENWIPILSAGPISSKWAWKCLQNLICMLSGGSLGWTCCHTCLSVLKLIVFLLKMLF